MAIKLDKESLENAFSDDKKKSKKKKSSDMPEMSKEEEIGFHKGSINTLAAERNELVKMIQNVEAILQAHLGRLEELGVKVNRD